MRDRSFLLSFYVLLSDAFQHPEQHWANSKYLANKVE